MQRSYYLTVDGGGTKLYSLLFDEKLKPVSSGTGGSINPHFTTLEEVRHSMEQSIEQCLAPLKGRDFRIEHVWISMPGPGDLYEHLLREHCEVGGFESLSEGETAIRGAGICTGMAIICGTGSTLFYIKDGKCVQWQGGWGSPFGDESSGTDIGIMGLRAALRSYDGWGMKTRLETEIPGFFGGTDFRSSVFKIWDAKDRRSVIASVCRLVEQCANDGDLCARGILAEAGHKAAGQVMAFIHGGRIPEDTPLVLAGGAWKSGDTMIRAFIQTLFSHYPCVEVLLPTFEPIMGPVISMAMGESARLSQDRARQLAELYPEFTCLWPTSSTSALAPFPKKA